MAAVWHVRVCHRERCDLSHAVFYEKLRLNSLDSLTSPPARVKSDCGYPAAFGRACYRALCVKEGPKINVGIVTVFGRVRMSDRPPSLPFFASLDLPTLRVVGFLPFW